MTTWDATLPQRFLIDGLEETIPDNRLRSDNDVGPAKVRRQQTLNVYSIKGSMILTVAQKTTLQTFVNTTTGGGILPFDFPDPNDPASSTVEVRFGKTLPVFTPRGPYWFTTIELEVLP